jgi:ectoine hydroxylase-related dioxygenase (phytanoyl-CoA dioxygenase family)
MIGPEAYVNYENHIEAIIKKEGLNKEYFTPEAGDVLIWHGNLIHGGSKWNDKEQTRKSMVCH